MHKEASKGRQLRPGQGQLWCENTVLPNKYALPTWTQG